MCPVRPHSPFDDATPVAVRPRRAGVCGNPDWFAALGYGLPMSIGSLTLGAVIGPTGHVLGVAWFGLGLCAMGLVGYFASLR